MTPGRGPHLIEWAARPAPTSKGCRPEWANKCLGGLGAVYKSRQAPCARSRSAPICRPGVWWLELSEPSSDLLLIGVGGREQQVAVHVVVATLAGRLLFGPLICGKISAPSRPKIQRNFHAAPLKSGGRREK